ncbi:uncharacterized protein NECHADRAFT_65054 [Fusarium vanettenii 77-13-4]|uniref:Phosphoglycerate mutase n=1 Tax=Fusarium vanettenii (strain ATCC MYA-4622 / CBS 123669 / FGSC 9596 / NRRL 45880 / 77-13-4) TaxID=660122 RepID=C7YVT1_FUSV7|nr:uncharacterized protein NECHADRAFT_65054 [Fusarium vanettenii 77-13-4]EEU44051.1 hypothetical protein NECHADRAFT_65054 [Fusarium vanettenii 77-13-4]
MYTIYANNDDESASNLSSIKFRLFLQISSNFINKHHAQLASSVASLSDATMRLLLIRHGETVDNVAGVYAGSRDSALTAHGVLQAGRLAAHLAEHVDVDHLFSSDLQRAATTAQAILDAQKRANEVKLVVTPELREKDFGSGEGVKFGLAFEFEGEETPEAMRKRCDRFLGEHLGPLLHEDSIVCIVAHGILLGVLYKALCARLSHVTIAPGAQARPRPASTPFHPSWSNTGYLEAVITALPDTKDRFQMRVDKVNSVEHTKTLKRTRGGIGSAKFDAKQKTMDSFFTPAPKKPKCKEDDIVSK